MKLQDTNGQLYVAIPKSIERQMALKKGDEFDVYIYDDNTLMVGRKPSIFWNDGKSMDGRPKED